MDIDHDLPSRGGAEAVERAGVKGAPERPPEPELGEGQIVNRDDDEVIGRLRSANLEPEIHRLALDAPERVGGVGSDAEACRGEGYEYERPSPGAGE